METVEQDSKARIEVYHLGSRRYPRCHIQLPIEYYQFKSSITRIANISEGGLLVYLPEEIDVGQYLRLKLFFSLGSELQTTKMLAEVVWKGNHLTEDGEYYPYGVTFVDISSGDWTKLVNLIRNLSSPLDNLESLRTTPEGSKRRSIFKCLDQITTLVMERPGRANCNYLRPKVSKYLTSFLPVLWYS